MSRFRSLMPKPARMDVAPVMLAVGAIVAFIVMSALMPVRAKGAEPECPDRKARVALAIAGAESPGCERDRKARVAFALSAEAAPVAAPAPHPKAPCPCGDGCKCPDGKCPACPAADLARVRDALVRVRCPDGSGSGTVIWSSGGRSVVLTAAHVVEGATSVTVRGNGKTHAASLIATDKALDLAALLVEVELPAVAVSAADPDAGDEVLMVGCTSLWSRGAIKSRDGVRYLLAYDSDPGDSSAGVFFKGELVGVHCGKCGPTTETCTTPYATGAKPIRTFLKRVFRRDGVKTVPVEPVAAKPVPAAAPPTAGRSPSRLNIGGVPHELRADGVYHPLTSGCPLGRCPLQR